MAFLTIALRERDGGRAHASTFFLLLLISFAGRTPPSKTPDSA
jgi:hypothetical protein